MSLEKAQSSESATKIQQPQETIESPSHLNGEDDEKGPIAYRMRPALADIFKTKTIKEIIQSVLTKTLQGKKYNVEDARKWTQEIADSISTSVKDLNMPRYKHVVQISLGQQLGAGYRYVAKCSWDAECDSYTSDVFSNASLFCVCTVFGIYVY
ncbi:dynein light chain Tctex-type protein 2B-like [Eupeodes corollae]|uniref:dynein light chain Tctex-type protein 2B-like n=1 Tax=Eupeodes corollae TaxID=290404 RepID=UPI0024901FD1|nr:dynein light chain Tctex-type protein 2B-like [Eupeodes corollae]